LLRLVSQVKGGPLRPATLNVIDAADVCSQHGTKALLLCRLHALEMVSVRVVHEYVHVHCVQKTDWHALSRRVL
jgi:hypothetical protein